MRDPYKYIKDLRTEDLRRIVYKYEHCTGYCEKCPCKTSVGNCIDKYEEAVKDLEKREERA